MIHCLINNKILYDCECVGPHRPALEHNINCPIRLGFFGAPIMWGVGDIDEIRIDDKNNYYIFSQTWYPLTEKEAIKHKNKIRKNKLNNIQKNKQ